MVVCKYYRQGSCRYGQYCQYEHVNSFGGNNKDNNEDKITATLVAKEVVAAERGGQWLLSSFAPFKECPCIPGMEDLSPEEVRWEMYQAQKNGTIEQAKMHFQQLCQDMKAKREALKNPTRETLTMLKNIVGANQKPAQPELANSTSTSNVFGNKPFGTQSNPFGGGGFTPTSNTSIFGRSNTTTSIFGGAPNFGSNLGFSGTTNTSTVFGSTTNTSVFGGAQNSQTFGTPQNNPVFGGGTSQSVFGKPSTFGGNVFLMPQTSQSTTSVFDSGATSSGSIFGGSSQSNTALFGGAKTTTSNLFGGSALQTTNSVFGSTASTGLSGSIFSQPKTTAAFGAAPVFGGVSTFTGNNASGSIFGGQPTFGNTAISSGNMFGGTGNTAPGFGSVSQPTNTFGMTAPVSTSTMFGSSQNTVMSVSSATPFGSATSTASTPFVTATSQFDTSSTTTNSFAKSPFALPAASTTETFGTTVTSSGTPFGTTMNTGFGTATSTSSPFTPSTFGAQSASPFASTSTTVTSTTANPFAARTQLTNSPFGVVPNQAATNTSTMPSNPFGVSPFGSATPVIDDSIYSVEGQLTDDEKSMYLAEKFTLGKIPLKPPTKDIR